MEVILLNNREEERLRKLRGVERPPSNRERGHREVECLVVDLLQSNQEEAHLQQLFLAEDLQ